MYYVYSFLLVCGGLFVVNFIFSYQSKHIDPHFWTTLKFQLMMLPLFLIANLSIGYGVKFGYKALHNLSYVLATSKGLELLISLLMGYLFYREAPTWKTALGLGIVMTGFIIAKIK
jgi:drug/metabolite transporter (DMT)-like permease